MQLGGQNAGYIATLQYHRARSITNYAALALAEGHGNATLYCLSARILSHRAALANARANVQHHGAMGCTFEHDSHFYVKRTHVLGHLLGGVDEPLVGLTAVAEQSAKNRRVELSVAK